MKTRFYILLSMTLLLLIQTGCIYDNDIPCGSEDTDLLVISLNLTVPSASVGTRSAGDDLVPGSRDENYINIIDKDYQVLIFDKDGTLVEGKLSEFECKENGVNGGMTSYTLTTKLSLSGDEDKERLSKFKVMVLANWESFEKSNTQLAFEYPSFAGYSVSGATNNIYKDGEHYNFTLKKKDDNSAWVPSIDKTQAIPMFGVTDDLDLQFVMDMAKYGDGPSFTIPMLRSLAKIEIVNKTPGEDNITINSCKLTAYNSKGRFIPDILEAGNADWNVPDIQVSFVSLPTEYDDGQLDREDLVFVSLDEGKTFTAYLPEMDLDKIKTAGGTMPQMEVEIASDERTVGTYNIDLGKYNMDDGKFSGTHYSAVLRNHKYTFNINKVEIGVKGQLTLSIETPEWDVDDDQEWAYEDAAVGFTDGGKFAWTDPKYESIIDDPNRILLVGHEPDDAVYGHFQFKPIASNNSCTWTLSLIADDDTKNNHFTIQINKSSDMAEGEWENCGDTVTHDLNSDVVEFRIMATESNGSTSNYSARLIMTVQTFDGRVAILNLTGTTVYDSSDERFYYVVKQITDGTDNM